MIKKLGVLGIILTSFFMLSCNNDDNETKMEVDIEKEIKATYSVFSSAFLKGDAKTVASTYTTDARLLVPNTPLIVGRSNIENFWVGFIKATGINGVSLTPLKIDMDSDTSAIEEGNFILSVDGTEVNKGKYIVIWRLEDGQWKLHQDIFNTDLPAAM